MFSRCLPALASTALTLAGVTPLFGGQTAHAALEDVNASAWPGTQGEVSIAVDRFDPLRVLAAAMNLQDGRLLTMASSDGGDSWSSSTLPFSEGTLHADPMVSFDSRGRAYLAVIPVGAGNTPLGIDVMHSDDGGASWSPSVRITKATGRDDKLALVVDDGPESRYRDRIHIAWKWPSGGIYYVRSDDRGDHFTRRRLIETATVSGLDLAVSREGDLYLAAGDGGEQVMRIMRSTDGGASFLPSVAVADVRADWSTSQPSHCQRQSLVHASVAIDRTEGPNRGSVYLTWADFATGLTAEQCTNACDPETACTTEIFFSRSSDDGRSWSPPAVLPGQKPGSDRYFPWLRADPSDGSLYVAYKDTALDPRRVMTDVFLSRSTDGGSSWESPMQLSSAPSDASESSFQYGDYQGLAVSMGRVFAAWSDYRDPADGEIYVGRGAFPVAPPPDATGR